VNLLDPLALALERSKSVKSTSFPLFKRIVEFVAIVDNLREPVPLLPIKPREPHNHLAIGSRLAHVCKAEV